MSRRLDKLAKQIENVLLINDWMFYTMTFGQIYFQRKKEFSKPLISEYCTFFNISTAIVADEKQTVLIQSLIKATKKKYKLIIAICDSYILAEDG